ncbi:MAG: biotin-dependent carboxyltransferase family protein [Hyphomonas sp.]
MTIRVLRPGPQATLQGAARWGLRHQGIPASGPADPLSMALANRLAGNAPDATAIELTFGGAAFEFRSEAAFAITGATTACTLSGRPAPQHETLMANPGERLEIASAPAGTRLYLAVAGGFAAMTVFASTSTFLPAGIGGLDGRALKAGDDIEALPAATPPPARTPEHLRPAMTHSHALRCVPGPDFPENGDIVWQRTFHTSPRMDRTGIEMTGDWPPLSGPALKPSSALFPGAVQLTPSGTAFALLPDSQTTGGYPHILQIMRADRHLLGQIRPGDRVHFLKRSAREAYDDLNAKAALFAGWLPGFRF